MSTAKRAVIPKTLSVFSLVMINVAAIESIKNWPFTAEYGSASLFFLLLAALIFFLPISLIAAELATGWHKLGGIFVWVKEAFGDKMGFLSVWLLWLENVIWYPTVLSFIAAAVSYAFDPDFANNKVYMVVFVLVLFWGGTLANLMGMKISSWISTIGVIGGTVVPGLFIIGLGLVWYFQGNPIQISFAAKDLIPSLTDPDQLVFFTGVMFSFAGMEMSAIHARDVKNPQKDYPKAILYSGLIILFFSLLGVLSIAMVIPQKEISLVAGSLQAFNAFLAVYKLHWLLPIIAILVAIGGIGSVCTWIAGPPKGLLAAAQNGELPPFFRQINKHAMPSNLMIAQAIVVSIISLLFIVTPTVSSAFWILTVITAQLYLIMYILMFSAAIKLRYSKPKVDRAYKIPGGKAGMWVVAGIGIIGALFAIVVGYFPPSQIIPEDYIMYFGLLTLGILLGCFVPFLILAFRKPSWSKPLSHEKR